jgi:hypothetical protein
VLRRNADIAMFICGAMSALIIGGRVGVAIALAFWLFDVLMARGLRRMNAKWRELAMYFSRRCEMLRHDDRRPPPRDDMH